MVFIFFITLGLRGQELKVRFEYLTRQQGLSNAEVYSLLQDKTGYLWIGTADGLNRYDGYSFKQLKHEPFNDNSLSVSFVHALAEDHDGNIWGGTGVGGINKIDPKRMTIRRFQQGDSGRTGLPDDHIRFLFVDHDNYLWIGSIVKGIVRCDLKTMSFDYITEINTDRGKVPLSVIRSITEDAQGHLWMGSSANEVIQYDPVQKRGIIHPLPHDGDQKDIAVNALHFDQQGILWAGTSFGEFISFNPKTLESSRHALPAALSAPGKKINILSLAEDQEGNLWIASSYGVFQYSFRSGQCVEETKNIRQNYQTNRLSRTLLIDRSKLIWIGTFADGLIKLIPLPNEPHNYSRASGLSNDYVRGMYEDKQGKLWIATSNHVTVFNAERNHFTLLKKISYPFNGEQSTYVTSVCGDNDDNIWFGTMNGVYKYFQHSGRVEHILGSRSKSNFAQDNYVYEVRYDKRGNIWVSIEGGGVVVLNDHGNIVRRYSTADSTLPINFVRTVLLDSDTTAWVGSFGAGLCRLNTRTGKYTTYGYVKGNSSSLSNNLILCLFKDSRNRLWIGTRTGLNLFDEASGTFKHYFTTDGLPNDLIVGILEDNDHNLWISTYYGMAKYNGESFQNYFAADGFQDDYNSGSSFTDRSGIFYFGGGNGLCMFTPESLAYQQVLTPIVISARKNSEHPVTIEVTPGTSEAIELSPSERSISFDFAKLDFRNREGNTYAYLLEGFDDHWVYSGTRRNVSYTNLRGGEYVFRVKAQGRNGEWREADSSVLLTVLPPLYERWWFYPLILLLIGSTAAAFYRSWIMRKLAVEKIRSNLAADLHDEIGSGLARIAVLSDILEQQTLSKIKGKAKPSAVNENRGSLRIGIISRELMESISDVVWSIDPRNDRSEQLLERISSYVTQVCEEAGIDLKITTDDLNELPLEPFMKRAILLIVKESMNNIVKHAAASHVFIQVKRSGKTLQLNIHDDGKGFEEFTLGRVNGLNNMRTRAEQSGGIINIYSTPGKGTLVESSFTL
ncbi:MAG: ligand-binding sensor domain-containing protein [Bacteroidota bacterium]